MEIPQTFFATRIWCQHGIKVQVKLIHETIVHIRTVMGLTYYDLLECKKYSHHFLFVIYAPSPGSKRKITSQRDTAAQSLYGYNLTEPWTPCLY